MTDQFQEDCHQVNLKFLSLQFYKQNRLEIFCLDKFSEASKELMGMIVKRFTFCTNFCRI